MDRVFYILSRLNNPHYNFKSIHIAGTNGKGSTASVIASILIEAGYKVGIYTSPHILHFMERFRINGDFIDESRLVDLINRIMPIGQEIEATFFEITTAIAFEFFSEEKVDFAIIEAGMGGKHDATNVLNPMLSVITKIDIDHVDYLGNSIEAITSEKAGIIKPNIPIVLQNNSQEIIDIIFNRANELNAEVYCADKVILNYNTITDDFKMLLDVPDDSLLNKSEHKIQSVLVDLPGFHQLENIKTAISAIKLIAKDYNVSNRDIINGLEKIKTNTKHRGRVDLLIKNPYLLVDVSHNPDSIKTLIKTLRLKPEIKDWTFIFGVMADKDIHDMIQQIRSISDRIILTQPSITRSEPAENLYNMAKEMNFSQIAFFDNVRDAVISHDFSNNNTIIAGSFYLIEETLLELNIDIFNRKTT